MKQRGAVLSIILVSVIMGVSLSGRSGAAAVAVRTVGIIDFYAPTPLGVYTFTPERFAAEDLSSLLAGAARGRFIVVSRARIARAEEALHWQNFDDLYFVRLRALAAAIGADSLVVGWIQVTPVGNGGGEGGPQAANANLLFQVFDVAQDIIVGETQQAVSTMGGTTRDLLAQETLHDAIARAAPFIAGVLSREPLSSRSWR